jgi:hypothetical protein
MLKINLLRAALMEAMPELKGAQEPHHVGGSRQGQSRDTTCPSPSEFQLNVC